MCGHVCALIEARQEKESECVCVCACVPQAVLLRQSLARFPPKGECMRRGPGCEARRHASPGGGPRRWRTLRRRLCRSEPRSPRQPARQQEGKWTGEKGRKGNAARTRSKARDVESNQDHACPMCVNVVSLGNYAGCPRTEILKPPQSQDIKISFGFAHAVQIGLFASVSESSLHSCRELLESGVVLEVGVGADA